MIEPIRLEMGRNVAHITLSAPERGNSLDPKMVRALGEAVRGAEADTSCRAICLEALGPHFCLGMDYEALETGEGQAGAEDAFPFADLLTSIHRSRLPVIACVEGNAMGGGVGLAAACDIVIAAPDAIFMLPEVIIGMLPALVAPSLLRRIGAARLRFMAVSSQGINATQAQTFGLVDIVADGQLADARDRQLDRLLRSSPEAIEETKHYLDGLCTQELDRQSDFARAHLRLWLGRPGVRDGIRAFAEGFSPPWFQKYRKA
jgi:enoyl-CoA hydratase/carnithine racemase